MTEITVTKKLPENISQEVERLAAEIDIYSITSINSFGGELAEQASVYTNNILEKARVADLEETGAQLNQILDVAQEFDLDSLENDLTRNSFFGGLIKSVFRAKQRAMKHFDSVKANVDKLVGQVEKTALLLGQRNNEYQMMYDSVLDEHDQLSLYVEAIKLRLADLSRELVALPVAADDIVISEKRAVLEANEQALSKRGDDLSVLQHSALQMLPMVRVIQANNVALIDKFNTIRQLTLPAWKRAFMLALALDEQKKSVHLAQSIDDTTNALLRRNAEMLHQNAVATAKSNQRMVVDIETLKEVHNKILLTFKDVKETHQNGKAARAEAIAELSKLRKEMISGIVEQADDLAEAS